MAFDLIAVRQYKPFTVSGEDGSIDTMQVIDGIEE